MLLFFAAIITAIVALSAARFFVYIHALASSKQAVNTDKVDAQRYRPMLRLLRDDEVRFGAANPAAVRKMRAERRKLFRDYLECLTKDYSAALDGIRRIIAKSAVDQPELAKALIRNRVLFAVVLCQLDVCLGLHAIGIGKVDVSAVLHSLDALQRNVHTLADSTVWGA